MSPPAELMLPVPEADSKTPSFKLEEPLIEMLPPPELRVKLPVVETPATPTPRA